MKNRIYIILSVFIFAVLFVLFIKNQAVLNENSITTKAYVKLFNGNKFNFITNNKITEDFIKIVDYNNSISYIGFENKNKWSGNLINDYGYSKFKMYFRDSLIAEMGHFKTNWWHTHKYDFTLNLDGNDLSIDFKIIGPDAKNNFFINRKI